MNWNSVKTLPECQIAKYLLDESSHEYNQLLKYAITRERIETVQNNTGFHGINAFNKYMRPIIKKLDTEEEYKILELWSSGGYVWYNSRYSGYHAGINGHGQDMIAAYPSCLMGRVPYGDMEIGTAKDKSDIQLVSIKFHKVQIKPQFKNLPPFFKANFVEQAEKYTKTDNKVYFTIRNEYEQHTLRLIDNFSHTFYYLKEELDKLLEVYDFDGLKVTNELYYKSRLGDFKALMEELYHCRGVTITKASICAMIGSCKRKPIFHAQTAKTREYVTFNPTKSIVAIWCWWKCRERIYDKCIELVKYGNTIVNICVDCVYWDGPTEAVLVEGMNGWSGIGDGVFTLPDGTTTKHATHWDECFIEHATNYGLNWKGIRIKTTHGSVSKNERLKNTYLLDFIALKNWNAYILNEQIIYNDIVNQNVEVKHVYKEY